MSGVVEWDERFSVGVKEIDDQHKELFKIIDSVFDGMAEANDREALAGAFDKIIEYTKYHFATEERYFKKFNYPDAQKHRQEHAKLLEVTLELKEKYTDGELGITLEVIDFLTEWLQHHILLHDKKYAPYMK